ncbi:hypothetical protein [Alkalimonas amylolytica]|uniref:Uncharacterized protein n=1 Tax=Alkalimonas amylolytica TaxID=152573 RepID=A0A1H4EX77_ALKAM|nr:hypothetical protein [Alkalimonas amylolytica]SEA88852.1 hypothetical protein SAMN04488051_10818 [Alkalimonas amylolytica]
MKHLVMLSIILLAYVGISANVYAQQSYASPELVFQYGRLSQRVQQHLAFDHYQLQYCQSHELPEPEPEAGPVYLSHYMHCSYQTIPQPYQLQTDYAHLVIEVHKDRTLPAFHEGRVWVSYSTAY